MSSRHYDMDGNLVEPAPWPALAGDELSDRERARLEAIGREHGLTLAEVQAAEASEVAPGEYAAWRNVTSPDDADAAIRSLADRDAARDEAERQMAVDREKEALRREGSS